MVEITKQQYLNAEKIVAEYKIQEKKKADSKIKLSTRGIDKYFSDLNKWENSFYCNECGCDKMTYFTYYRTVANGEVWCCKNCKKETIVDEQPNENNY